MHVFIRRGLDTRGEYGVLKDMKSQTNPALYMRMPTARKPGNK